MQRGNNISANTKSLTSNSILNLHKALLIELYITFRLLYQTCPETSSQNMNVQQVKLQISIVFKFSNRSKINFYNKNHLNLKANFPQKNR